MMEGLASLKEGKANKRLAILRKRTRGELRKGNSKERRELICFVLGKRRKRVLSLVFSRERQRKKKQRRGEGSLPFWIEVKEKERV